MDNQKPILIKFRDLGADLKLITLRLVWNTLAVS